MLRGGGTNTNFIVFGLTRSRLEPTSTAFEASTLTITPPMRLYIQRGLGLRIMVFDATFNNISVITWRSESGVEARNIINGSGHKFLEECL